MTLSGGVHTIPVVKRSVAKCVFDRATIHTENASSGTSFAPEQNCSALLLKVEHPVSDRFLKRSGPSLNTFLKQKLQWSLILVNSRLQQLSLNAIQIEPAQCEQH